MARLRRRRPVLPSHRRRRPSRNPASQFPVSLSSMPLAAPPRLRRSTRLPNSRPRPRRPRAPPHPPPPQQRAGPPPVVVTAPPKARVNVKSTKVIPAATASIPDDEPAAPVAPKKQKVAAAAPATTNDGATSATGANG